MARTPPQVNNAVYDELGELWFTAQDNPVALLRAEGLVTQAWVMRQLAPLSTKPLILDIGCGAGFATQRMSQAGYRILGVDLSEPSLRIARNYFRGLGLAAPLDNPGGRDGCVFSRADAMSLPFGDAVFDAVLCLDFLEHVENPRKVIAEAARVLKPGGLFFFHTFNRTFIAYFFAAKGLEWVVRHTPKHLHVWRLFLKPSEVSRLCQAVGLEPQRWIGIRPHWLSWDFLRLLLTGRVPETFYFKLTSSMAISYMGMAQKQINKV
jgi:2-polyprenyl-6-hydroxyphenyl methylase / 3-demethylubiquinone-9 3-methyltransferase